MAQLRGRRPVELETHPDDDPADSPGDPTSVAKSICLSQLALRARSRAELADVLRRRGIPPEVAAEVLDRFEDVGLINDADFAALVVDSRIRGKGLSRRALAEDLRSRGVADEVAQQALSQLQPESEYAMARRVAERRLGALGRGDQAVIRRRVYAALGRRGFSAELSRQVLDELLGEAATGDSEPE